MSTPRPYSWQNRRCAVTNGRLAWYSSPGNEHYWYDYWKARLNTGYYAAAEKRDLSQDELGKVLLKQMLPEGLHLEAGCGAGFWVAALLHHGLQVEGIEYVRELVNLVHQAYPQLSIRYANALAIDRPNDYYDSYLSFGVVEHRIEGPEPFLQEAYRVLKPGGKIIISVPFFGPVRQLKYRLRLYERKQSALPFFQYAFRRKELTTYLEQAGFVIEETRALYVDRLLVEEVLLYRWLAFRLRNKFIRKLAERFLRNRDGHMLLVIGRKPASRNR